MIEPSKVTEMPHYHNWLNAGFRSDLEWWAMFLPGWNGVGMLSCLGHLSYTVIVTSDDQVRGIVECNVG